MKTHSVEPMQVKDYKEDPLNFVGKVRARTGNELLKVLHRVPRAQSQSTLRALCAYDGAPDEQLRTWLLVNTSRPSMGSACSADTLIARTACGMLALVVFSIIVRRAVKVTA